MAHTALFERLIRASRIAAEASSANAGGCCRPGLAGLTCAYRLRQAGIDAKDSYSYWKVSQDSKFAGAEGERSGNCQFAGEHTSIDAQGISTARLKAASARRRKSSPTSRNSV